MWKGPATTSFLWQWSKRLSYLDKSISVTDPGGGEGTPTPKILLTKLFSRPLTNFAPKKNAVSFLNKMFGLRGSLCAPNAPHCRQAAIFGAEPGWLRGPGPYLDADITGMATRQPLGGAVGANFSLFSLNWGCDWVVKPMSMWVSGAHEMNSPIKLELSGIFLLLAGIWTSVPQVIHNSGWQPFSQVIL